MNNLTLILVYLLCGFFLSACSTTASTNSFIPLAANSEQAIVYIYRPDVMPNSLYSPGITINDNFKLYAKNGINSRLTLQPGTYLFELQNEKKYSELTALSLILKASSIYFIRVDTSLKIKSSTSYEPYARKFTLTQINEPLAVKEITKCCVNSSKKNITKSNANNKNTADGFSVDKTQNPFSH